jgi:ketosteroid isomerase-like protein
VAAASESVRLTREVSSFITGRDLIALFADPDELGRAREDLMPLVEPDFEVAMVAPEYTPQGQTTSGFEGFLGAWLDWTSAYASFRIDIDEVIEAGDRVVSLGRQTATTKTGGVEIESFAGAVMTVREGRVSRMEFHLDREATMRAAGLEP